jgi:hypothetical protein
MSQQGGAPQQSLGIIATDHSSQDGEVLRNRSLELAQANLRGGPRLRDTSLPPGNGHGVCTEARS